MDHKLKDKIVWITGASSGIGKFLSIEMAKRGAICVVTARRKNILDDLCQQIQNSGGKAYAYVGDVTNLDEIKRVASDIKQEFGKLDLLVANAGNHIFTKPLNFDSSEYMNLMNVNYGGMLYCIEAVMEIFKTQGYGKIVGMASLAGYRGLPKAAAYGASKSAMNHFLESIRFHFERENINVTIVDPGFVKTPLTDKNDFQMPFLVSPERASRIICDSLEKGKKLISFPIPFNWFINFLRIIPYFIYEKLVRYQWKKMKFS